LKVLALASVLLLAGCSQNPAPPVAAPPAPIVTLCGADSPLAEVDRAALCATRAALKETDLPNAWRAVGGPVARVILAPAGQPALSVRVVGNVMVVRRLSHGRFDVERIVALSDGERHRLIDAGAAVWSAVPPLADAPTLVACKAPSYIAAETNLNGVVKFAVSRCVALKPLRDLADAYLALASEKVPELKQGLEQSLD